MRMIWCSTPRRHLFYQLHRNTSESHRHDRVCDPDLGTVKTFVSNLASPNGIALSTDGSILWVTETAAGVLHRIAMNDSFRSTAPYRFEGFYGPDSCSVDEDDNLYVAMARQGRVMVFNSLGFLIGQVITPDCEHGVLMVRPSDGAP